MGATGGSEPAEVLSQRRVRLVVSGRVQGVFYRQSAVEQARALSLSGWVRNLPDGRVEAAVQGSGPAVERFVAWARVGPPAARVNEVSVRPEPPRREAGPFHVRG
ncbi:MAG TPA: acylphosphatase [Actinomycetota bacterium]